ncbi:MULTISPECIES: metallophosphoesterase [Clostridium]|uniref:metallophosphoesterase n=1 Tax=Clostridium TaxID=1485 RepID=UPI0009BD2299|nr:MULTISPECIES: metallophosphoesterase [Clostridium]PJI08973.1 metallophosphoesterase [Clostridium sp. CT7]
MKTMLITIGNIILELLILFLYTMLWYYVGKKGSRILFTKRGKANSKIYWTVFWFLAFSFILAAIARSTISINNRLTETLTVIGAVSIALFFYLIILFPMTDIMKFILNKLGFSGNMRNYLSVVYGRGISIFAVVIVIFCFGFWHANHQSVTNYKLNINKKAGNIKTLNVVMVSDVHMGIMIRENGINKMVNSINKLKPDIVFFCGDMVDESTPTSLKKYYGREFKNIKSKYGVYSITGNHEYYSDNVSETIKYMKKANVRTLQDEAVKVDNSFYVVGRNDSASGKKPKPLKDILKGRNKALPIIELNHKPVALDEAEKNGVDLQLSGHTHDGQVFPFNLTTNLVFKDAYGYLNEGNFKLIVTSGYGTWGPPMRIGTKGEIVDIKLKFVK